MYSGIVNLLCAVLIFCAFLSVRTYAHPGQTDDLDDKVEKLLRFIERNNKETRSLRTDISDLKKGVQSLKESVQGAFQIVAEQLGVTIPIIVSDDEQDKSEVHLEKNLDDINGDQSRLLKRISFEGEAIKTTGRRKFKRDAKLGPVKSLLEVVLSNSENINKLVTNAEMCNKTDETGSMFEAWKESTDSFFVATFLLLSDIAYSTSARIYKNQDIMEDLTQFFESTILSKNKSQFFLEKTETLQDWYLHDNTSIPKTFSSCKKLNDNGLTNSGVYNLTIGIKPGLIDVFCDQDTDGGGWLVIQRRQDGTVEFNRSWTEYKMGFGSPNGEFWIGNDILHYLTTSSSQELRVDLTDFDGAEAFAKYSTFVVGNETNKYRLTVKTYSGNAGDSLNYHNGWPFSTVDKDNDNHSENCAATRDGAWWYKGCDHSNLNGPYLQSKQTLERSITWFHWKSTDEALKKTEMKIRPIH